MAETRSHSSYQFIQDDIVVVNIVSVEIDSRFIYCPLAEFD